MIELTIIIKDSSRKMSEKEIIYDESGIRISKDNEELLNRVKKSLDKFGKTEAEESPDITVSAKLIF